MKLTVGCLGLLVALCYVISPASGSSRYSRERRSTKVANKFIVMNCPDGGRAEEEVYKKNTGVVFYSGTFEHEPRRCTFLITGPPGHDTEIDVMLRTETGEYDCDDGGTLAVYKGADTSGAKIVESCDRHNKETFYVNSNQIFVDYQKDDHKSVMKVIFRFFPNSRRRTLLDLFEAFKLMDDKEKKEIDIEDD